MGPCIIASPFLKQLRIPETAVRIILASDGVWDACNNAAAARPVRKFDTETAASAIVAAALKLRGLRDDTTVICLDLCPDAAPLADHWAAMPAEAAPRGRTRGGLLCGLCGGGDDDADTSHTPRMREIREVDFYSIAQADAPASSSGRAFVLPRVLPRSGGRISSRNADNEVSVRPLSVYAAPERAGGGGAPESGEHGVRTPEATEHAGRMYAEKQGAGGGSGETSSPRLGAVSEEAGRGGGGGAGGNAAQPVGALAAAEDITQTALGDRMARRTSQKGTHHWGNASERDIEQVFAAVSDANSGRRGSGSNAAPPPEEEQQQARE